MYIILHELLINNLLCYLPTYLSIYSGGDSENYTFSDSTTNPNESVILRYDWTSFVKPLVLTQPS